MRRTAKHLRGLRIALGQLLAVGCTLLQLSPCVAVAVEPSVELFGGHLQRTVRELESCHMVAAVRWNGRDQVLFYDLWLSGDHAQLRATRGDGAPGGNWWDDTHFDPLAEPLTASNVDSVPGIKFCLRPDSEVRWAYSRLSRQKTAPYPSLYTLSGTAMEPPGFPFVPLLTLNRSWSTQKSGWPAINLVAERPMKGWRLIGSANINRRPTYIVEIDQGPGAIVDLRRHKGKLKITSIWRVWFAADQGHLPIRIEATVRYSFGGKDYLSDRSQSAVPSNIVYEANDLFEFEAGLWFPRSGIQQAYVGSPQDPIAFDPDKIADSLLANDKFIDEQQYVLKSKHEWRVIKLNKIAPTDALWFDPPTGAKVHNLDVNSVYIQGVSESESRRILGKVKAEDLENQGTHSSGRQFVRWALIGLNAVVVAFLATYLIVRKRPASNE